MTLKKRLASIHDVFSRRSQSRGAGYPPDEISGRVRHGILLLYRDLVSGRWKDQPWAAVGNDHTHEFWEEMHNSLQHLHRRPQLCFANIPSDVRITTHT